MYHPRPTDDCRCHSGKRYKDCCQKLTKLPKNPSKDLRRRFWGKIVDECFFGVLSKLDEEQVLDPLRDDALYSLEGEEHTLECATNEHGLPLLDAFAIFHHQLDADVPELKLEGIDELEMDEEDEGGIPPIGAIHMISTNVRPNSPQGIAFNELLFSPISWFRVLEVVRGEGVRLFDELQKEEFFVDDIAISLSAMKGMILCGKVLQFEGINLLFGTGAIALHPGSSAQITSMADKLRDATVEDGDVFDRTFHLEIAAPIASYYFRLVNESAQKGPPQIQNTDGDPLEPKILRFRYQDASIEDMADQIFAKLPKGEQNPPVEMGAKDATGKVTELIVPYIRRPTEPGSTDTVLVAFFKVRNGEVEVEVNSANRAEEIRKLVKKQLSDTLTFVEEVAGSKVGSNPPGATTIDPASMPPEIREALTGHMEKLQEQWLDTPIPALGGKTPKEAAQDPKTRPQLEALLDGFAIREGQLNTDITGPIGFNVTELRTRLGFVEVN